MAQFTLIKDKDPNNHYDFTRVQVSFDAICLEDMLESYEDFLRGCGFMFDGELGVVKDRTELHTMVPNGKDPTEA